ncbi:hypothetical protein SNE40_008740 [Patella caerulea]|uniref:C-type lectin domain-containing protein n=1 Tax=Patella caerulea TaxID=87958 RepID=A0AAN8JQM0_PATCE
MNYVYVFCFILSTPVLGYVVYVHGPTLTRQNASQCCQFHGMNLVQIDSLTKNDFIGNMVHQISGQLIRAWIGLYRAGRTGTFQWDNGEIEDFQGWRIGGAKYWRILRVWDFQWKWLQMDGSSLRYNVSIRL